MRMQTPCREITRQNTDEDGIFGDSFDDLNAKLLHGRYGADRADHPTLGGSGVDGARPG